MEAGRTIGGKYRLRKQIGAGGMGTVWSAVHETLDRMVAIKFLSSSGSDAQTAAARFVVEAKSAAKVKHRYVVDVFDFGVTEDGIHYMVQELLEGEELAACFEHGPAWPVRDAVQFMCDCLEGLEAVHNAGIVHRDLKPENIFVVRESGRRVPKLLDFGISKASSAASGPPSVRPPGRHAGRQKQLTLVGTALGSPWYMSPEQLRGSRELDARADIYSVGVVLYEWLTGRVPYQSDNMAELSHRIAVGDAAPLSALRPELGQGLSDVVMRAVASAPEGRWPSAAALRAALLPFAHGVPSDVWTIMQPSGPASARAPGVVAVAPDMRRVGGTTGRLLESANDPFGEDDDPQATLRRLDSFRFKPWWLAMAALLLAVATVPALLQSRSERASAAEQHRATARGQVVEREPAPLVVAGQPVPLPIAPRSPEPRPESVGARLPPEPVQAPVQSSAPAEMAPGGDPVQREPQLAREAAAPALRAAVPVRAAPAPVPASPAPRARTQPRARQTTREATAPAPSPVEKPRREPTKKDDGKIVHTLDF